MLVEGGERWYMDENYPRLFGFRVCVIFYIRLLWLVFIILHTTQFIRFLVNITGMSVMISILS